MDYGMLRLGPTQSVRLGYRSGQFPSCNVTPKWVRHCLDCNLIKTLYHQDPCNRDAYHLRDDPSGFTPTFGWYLTSVSLYVNSRPMLQDTCVCTFMLQKTCWHVQSVEDKPPDF